MLINLHFCTKFLPCLRLAISFLEQTTFHQKWSEQLRGCTGLIPIILVLWLLVLDSITIKFSEIFPQIYETNIFLCWNIFFVYKLWQSQSHVSHFGKLFLSVSPLKQETLQLWMTIEYILWKMIHKNDKYTNLLYLNWKALLKHYRYTRVRGPKLAQIHIHLEQCSFSQSVCL